MGKFDYHPICNETGKKQGDYRFLLEQPGNKMLIVIGLNPSTADEAHPDPTMRKIMGFMDGAGYDGFAMINLSAERSTFSYALSGVLNEDMARRNMETAADLVRRHPGADVLVAFGDGIRERPYLKECFRHLYDVMKSDAGNWLQIGNLTAKGNPRHPSRAGYDLGLQTFEAEKYFSRIKI